MIEDPVGPWLQAIKVDAAGVVAALRDIVVMGPRLGAVLHHGQGASRGSNRAGQATALLQHNVVPRKGVAILDGKLIGQVSHVPLAVGRGLVVPAVGPGRGVGLARALGHPGVQLVRASRQSGERVDPSGGGLRRLDDAPLLVLGLGPEAHLYAHEGHLVAVADGPREGGRSLRRGGHTEEEPQKNRDDHSSAKHEASCSSANHRARKISAKVQFAPSRVS